MSDTFDPIENMRRCFELVKELPPLPWRIMASHSVPWPKTYRQWDAKGRLLVWVNRGALIEWAVDAPQGGKVMLYDGLTEIVPISIPVEFV